MTTTHCPTVDDVFAAIGTEICSFLAPRDLVPLTLTNQHISKNVREKLYVICLKQLKKLPAAGDDGATAVASVAILKKHSFSERGELAGYLMEKIKVANLRYNPVGRLNYTDTLEETLVLTKEAVSDESQWFEGAWYGTFKTDPVEIWKPITKPLTVGCRFDEQLWGGRECGIDSMLRNLGHENIKAKHKVVRDWAHYLISQEATVGREWHWQCNGHEGVGFMIYTPDGGEQLEISLTKTMKATEPEKATPPTPSLLSAFGL